MANHKSALKRAKQNEVKRMRNKSTRSAMKTAIKKVQAAKDQGAENITELMQYAQSVISKAAKKGILHQNTASRKISRLSKYVSA
ncbi:30S ribosomal protein S20 [Desulfamplus magnetovallimortis]|uniref:Small ribosomal subunit protein bS20 n=1 Tax=Desulfamplus magnetovallimortis TaxID=1246637 RepID=A0A1W1H628_9BACT|nr:30S ribosomal protein S20 [Desulfamplus magnetovallimortis]SLM27902.1 30S ribosomal protein S20 [Desulfamplus magnetovallimortis]